MTIPPPDEVEVTTDNMLMGYHGGQAGPSITDTGCQCQHSQGGNQQMTAAAKQSLQGKVKI